MKKYIESYHMFFPDRIFGILLYLVYPVLVLGALMIENIFINNNYINLLITSVFVFIIECMADLFVFAGYARKNNNRHEYLKTSVKYIQMLRMAFIFDIIRRILSTSIIIFVTASILKIPYIITSSTLISLNFFIIITLCVLRFFDFFTIYYIITTIMVLAYIFFTNIVFIKNTLILVCIIMLVIIILAILLHINILLKVMKEGYYD